MAKVALITGGGLFSPLLLRHLAHTYPPHQPTALASLLLHPFPSVPHHAPWHIHIVDANPSAGSAAAASLPHATFHHADVTDYSALSAVFAAVFAAEKRLKFVFGNAGIVERHNFIDAAMEQVQGDSPPSSFPDGIMKVLDVKLKSVLFTTFLTTHCMIKGQGGGDVVLTSSAVGMYPSALAPVDASAKHGVLGLARSLAPRLHANHNIRVNALCPGMVPTTLLADDEWVKIVSSSDTWTPVSCVADAVLRVVDRGTDPEKPVVDSVGKEVKVGEMFGRTFECRGKEWYWRDPVPFCDETMEVVMGSNAQRKLWSKERVE